MFETISGLWKNVRGDRDLEATFAQARERVPVPVLWLLGRTQSGKSSITKYLTGSNDAEIGEGYKPTTKHSREYPFPDAESPLITILDTRGIDEPNYDSSDDVRAFNQKAHLVVITVKALDHGQENVLKMVEMIRNDNPRRPILLALTCLHEADPTNPLPMPYPFGSTLTPNGISENLARSITAQSQRFQHLVDGVVCIDITRPEEGYPEPNYGGEALKTAILEHLPESYRQSMLMVDRASQEFRDAALRRARPVILGYTALAAGAGAIPIPFVDLLLLPVIQSRMITDLSKVYNQPTEGKRFLEIASSLGLAALTRQASRELAKAIPFVGSAASASLAGASTYALGRACCLYFRSIQEGHIPTEAEIREYFEESMNRARK